MLEPLLLGLALAPTPSGFALALAVAAAFLIRNPLRVVLRARSAGSPRLAVARRVASVYSAVAVAGIAACAGLAGFEPMWPLAVVSPLVILFVRFDARNQGRSLAAELLAPVGLGAATPAIVIAAGWATVPALATWVVVVIKALPTVIYIRARLRLEDGEDVSAWPAALMHAGSVAIALLLWRAALAPAAAAIALAVLGIRGAIGLTPARWGRRPKQIGILEFVFSGLYVIALAVGYRLMRG